MALPQFTDVTGANNFLANGYEAPPVGEAPSVFTPANMPAQTYGSDASPDTAQLGIPGVGQPFTTGPWAGYVLIGTVPAVTSGNLRLKVDIENITGQTIVLVRDDGTAAAGHPPNNASAWALGAGTGFGSQGGAWATQTFLGRIQIYAQAGCPTPTVLVD